MYGVTQNYDAAFYFAGIAIFISGLMLLVVPWMLDIENLRIIKNEKLAWLVGKREVNGTPLSDIAKVDKSLGQMMLTIHADFALPLGLSQLDQRRISEAAPNFDQKRKSSAVNIIDPRRKSMTATYIDRRRMSVALADIGLPLDFLPLENRRNSVTVVTKL